MKTLRLAAVAAAVAVLAACGMGVEDGQELGLDEAQSELAASPKFETFQGRDGQYYFHLLAGNGEKVLVSEGYASLSGAKNGISTVRKNGVIESRYLLREASNGDWYFILVGGNGQIIGVSEMYASTSDAERGMATVLGLMQQVAAQAAAAPTNDARFQIFRGLDGKYYFHVRARNGEIVLQSQGYASSSGAKNGANSVNTNGSNPARYTVLPAADGRFYFTLKAGNGQVIGRSEMYETKSNAERGIADCVDLFTVQLPR